MTLHGSPLPPALAADLVADWVGLPSTARDGPVIARWRALLDAGPTSPEPSLRWVREEPAASGAPSPVADDLRGETGVVLLQLPGEERLAVGRWHGTAPGPRGAIDGFLEAGTALELALWDAWNAPAATVAASIAWGQQPTLAWTAGLEPAPWGPFSLAAQLRQRPITIARDRLGTPFLPEARPGALGRLAPRELEPGEQLARQSLGLLPCRLHDVRGHGAAPGEPAAEAPAPRRDLLGRLLRSACLERQLASTNLPPGTRAWFHVPGDGRLLVLGIRQRYQGLVKQVAAAALGATWGRIARWVVVVDDDVEVTDLQDVMWGVCTRFDPQRALTWLADEDSPTRTLILDACWPHGQLGAVPRSCATDPTVLQRVDERWGSLLRSYVRG